MHQHNSVMAKQLQKGMRLLPFSLILFFSMMAVTAFAQRITYKHGDLIRSEKIGTYDQDKLTRIVNTELEQFLNGSPMPFDQFKGKFAVPQNAVNLYKLTYQTLIPEKGGKPTIATSLVAIPDRLKENMPIVSYQHGTVFGKEEVPSNPDHSMETKLMIAQFGGQGYIVIGADYIGLGDSKEPNSYFAQKSTEQACMDMYAATRQFLRNLKITTGAFFTMGWSQGGYNNMIFLRKLEQAGIAVAASATASAPVDLSFFITRGIANPRPNDAVYTPASFANMLFSFEHYYGKPGLAADAIRPEYVSLSRSFYEHRIGFMDFLQKTTGRATEFLKPAFMEQIKAGTHQLSKILYNSEGYRWVSVTPLRAYYGMKDEAVPDYLARLAVEYQALLGKKNGQAINAGDNADHRATYIYALIDCKPWFDGFCGKQ